MAEQFWQVESHAANLRQPRFTTLVNPLRPSSGLMHLFVDGHPLSNISPLCVGLRDVDPCDSASIVEHYARGGDLVVTYADRPELAMRTEIYWRAGSHALDGAIAAIELVVSVQTSLLDSCPRLATYSKVAADQVLQLSDRERVLFEPVAQRSTDNVSRHPSEPPDCFLFRLAGAEYSYLEIVHPSDAQSSNIPRPAAASGPLATTSPHHFELRHQLFAETLEKGVILRARVLGMLLDRDDDEAAAARHYATFITERLPLTT